MRKPSAISRWFDRDRNFAYAILVPSLLCIAAFAYYPALTSLRFSFLHYNVKAPNNVYFSGLADYLAVLQDPAFWTSVRLVLYFMVAGTVAVMLIALLIGLLINERFPGRRFIRAIVIIPWAIPPIVNGYLWKWIFDGDHGAFNGLLYQLGIIGQYQHWLIHPFVALNISMFTFVWRYVPFVSVLFLGALQSIPDSLYEAARVDGANVFQQFLNVTLPAIYRIGGVALVLTLIASFGVFDEIYALMGFDESTRTPMMYNYQVTFVNGQFGVGAAMAYLVGAAMLGLTIPYIRMSLREEKI
ncbi:MAG TPA: sugar ABC transporter permease [Spirochaetia bacterium]|nr:sugar ABC transporter permease [Spirochaetia bacterium]